VTHQHNNDSRASKYLKNTLELLLFTLSRQNPSFHLCPDTHLSDKYLIAARLYYDYLPCHVVIVTQLILLFSFSRSRSVRD
jgi:hypothetical protein